MSVIIINFQEATTAFIKICFKYKVFYIYDNIKTILL